MTAGEKFQNTIDNNLENADIICLLISDNFLSSKACLDEKDHSLKLSKSKGIAVIPIILSPCIWQEHKEISELLAIPTDGKPVTSFQDQNEGWVDTINWIKKECNKIANIKNIKIREDFNHFLNSTDILSKSHKDKEILKLDDVFVYPKLTMWNIEGEMKKYNSEKIKCDILSFGKFMIAGENQSGKTTFCKKLYGIYRDLNFIPIYIEDNNKFMGNPLSKLESAFKEQYENMPFEDIDSDWIVPIIDNFHFAKYPEKYIEQYSKFKYQVLIVDNIFSLNFKSQNLTKEYKNFQIRELTAIERNELVKKWVLINEYKNIQLNPNILQQSIDEKTELIENSLGTVFGKGIMPSYPFFILSILSAQDIQKPLDHDITSQGYCYQSLIYFYLRKEGVKNEQIEMYYNFLTELSFWIYKNSTYSLSDEEFKNFISYYESRFNLPIQVDKIIIVLSNVNICGYNSLNQYEFCYPYIYYFFVAKYISEHLQEEEKLITKIIENLHKDENAYITIFLAHHNKSNYLLDEILLNAQILFEKSKPSTLDSQELSFFDKNEDKIIKAILPTLNHSSENERTKILEQKSRIEESKTEIVSEQIEEDASELSVKLRLAVKTVEVMGIIIKNRSGSLDKAKLESIYEEGLKVHQRIIGSFIETIENESEQKDIIEFLTERINHIIQDRKMGVDREKIEKVARMIFWNTNFAVIYGFITMAIRSLGSINLLNVSKMVTLKENTPSSFIVNQGINMWYGKNIRIDEIADRIKQKDFSNTAKQLIRHKIVEHCKLHNISYKDLQRVQEKLNIPSKTLLAKTIKQ